MSWLVSIEKLQAGRRRRHHVAPMVLLRCAARCLPSPAIQKLADQGINLPGILLARRLNIAYSTKVEVMEKGVPTTVIVSWQP